MRISSPWGSAFISSANQIAQVNLPLSGHVRFERYLGCLGTSCLGDVCCSVMMDFPDLRDLTSPLCPFIPSSHGVSRRYLSHRVPLLVKIKVLLYLSLE